MRAYYHDNANGAETGLHDSGRAVTGDDLKDSGILYWHIPVDGAGKWEAEIEGIAQRREYKNRDVKESSRAILGDAFDASQKVVLAEWVVFFVICWLKFMTTTGL